MNVMYLNVYGLYVYKKKAKENYLNKTQKRKHRFVLYLPPSVGHCLQWKEIDNCSSPSSLSNGMGSSEKAFVLRLSWKVSPDALNCATKLKCFAFRFEDCVLLRMKYFCNGNVWSGVISFSEHTYQALCCVSEFSGFGLTLIFRIIWQLWMKSFQESSFKGIPLMIRENNRLEMFWRCLEVQRCFKLIYRRVFWKCAK